mgnify:CR=1 FL=1
MLGETISHYKILEEIGQGASGIVYKAKDLKLNRLVALKVLADDWRTDPEAGLRFQREAQAASALDHSNICTIHAIEETPDGRPFIVMAHYEGQSLKDRINEGPLEIAEAVDILRQLCSGMAKAHEAGIVHRDLKPANIFLTFDGAVKILDFGIAKLAGSERLTRSGSTLGTVAYMSPEQIQDVESVDHRSDIWSVGVIFFEMLTGELPFDGEFEQTMMYAIVNQEAKSVTNFRGDVEESIENSINKALAKALDDRYDDVEAIYHDMTVPDNKIPLIKEKRFDTVRRAVFSGKCFSLRTAMLLVALTLSGIAMSLIILKIWRAAILARERVIHIPDQPLLKSSGSPEKVDLSIAILLPEDHERVLDVASKLKFPEILTCKISHPERLKALEPYIDQVTMRHFWKKTSFIDIVSMGFFDRIDDMSFWLVVSCALNAWLLFSCLRILEKKYKSCYRFVTRIPKTLQVLWIAIGLFWILYTAYYHKTADHGVINGAFWTSDFIPGVRTTQIIDFLIYVPSLLAAALALVVKIQIVRAMTAVKFRRFFRQSAYLDAWEFLINSGYFTFAFISVAHILITLLFKDLILAIDKGHYIITAFIFQSPFIGLTVIAWFMTRSRVDYKLSGVPMKFFWISAGQKAR